MCLREVSDMSKTDNDNVREVLLSLKRVIHDKAVYPNNQSVPPYISLKTFDAVLQQYLIKYDDRRR